MTQRQKIHGDGNQPVEENATPNRTVFHGQSTEKNAGDDST